MSKAFAWIILVLAALMLCLQMFVAESTNIPVTGLWLVVGAACTYYLFFKKRRLPSA